MGGWAGRRERGVSIKTSHDDRFDNGAVKRTLGLPQNVLRTSRNPYAAEL